MEKTLLTFFFVSYINLIRKFLFYNIIRIYLCFEIFYMSITLCLRVRYLC